MTDQQPNHPISIERVFFTKCSVIAVPNHRPVDGQINSAPVNAIDVKKTEGTAGHYAASMRTIVNPTSDKAYPYTIDIECVGTFLVDDTLSESDAFRGVTITAHSVLYGAIRETTAWLTGRQPYGTLTLGLSILRGKPSENAEPTAKTK